MNIAYHRYNLLLTAGIFMNLKSMRSVLVLVVASWVFALSANAAVLQINNGRLTGATGVSVDSVEYDVQFKDGTCNSLYDNCSNFTFNTRAAATLAGTALLSQVFTGQYSDFPNLTNGCDDPLFTECQILTPYANPEAGIFSAITTFNRSTIWNADDTVWNNVGISFEYGDSSGIPTWTFAVWSQAAVEPPITSDVPEPSTVGLVALGLAAFTVSRRRKPTAK